MGVVSGSMNMVSILGATASNAALPLLVKHNGWLAAFGSGTAVGLLTAVIWVVLARRLRMTLPAVLPEPSLLSR